MVTVPILSNIIAKIFEAPIMNKKKKYQLLDFRKGPRLIARYNNKPNIHYSHSFYKHKISDLYHYLIDLTWWKLFILLSLVYVCIHMIFALFYYLSDGVKGMERDNFIDCFWFSIHTMSTIGFGNLYPDNLASNIMVGISSWTAYFVDAFIISLVLGKFSRPSRMSRNIVFSKRAVLFRKKGKFSIGNGPVNMVNEPLKSNKEIGYGTTSDYQDSVSTNKQSEIINFFRSHSSSEYEPFSDEIEFPTYQNDAVGVLEKSNKNPNHDNNDIQADDNILLEDEDEDFYISFRCCNLRAKSTLIDTSFKLLCIIHDSSKSEKITVHELDFKLSEQMDRNIRVQFSNPILPLPWTITHQITKKSPLYSFISQYRETSSVPMSNAPSFEIVPVLDATDGGTSHGFQARFSYRPDEIYVDCQLEPCLFYDFYNHCYKLDFGKFHSVREL